VRINPLKRVSAGVLLFSCLFSAYSSQWIELPPIRIEKSFYFEREKESFIFQEPQEILEYFSFLDLKKRNDFGIQQDLSIRGANFENNFIFLDSILFNHPQTGHFNLEIPHLLSNLTSCLYFLIRADKS